MGPDSILAMKTCNLLIPVFLAFSLIAAASAQTDRLLLRDAVKSQLGSVQGLHAEGVLWLDPTTGHIASHAWGTIASLVSDTVRSIAFGKGKEQVVGRLAGVVDGVLRIEGTLLGTIQLRVADLPPRPAPAAVPPSTIKTPLEPSDWKGRFAIGSTLAAGNRDVLSGTIDVLCQKDFRYDHFEVKLSAIYGKANSVVSNNSQTLGSRYKHFLGEDSYGFVGVEFSRDPVKSLEMRGLLNLGVGWSLWDGGKGQSLDIEAGAGFRYENLSDETRSDGTARVALFWKDLLFEDVSLSQKLEGIVPVGDFASWLGRSETVVSVPLNDSWSFRTSLKLDYQAVPAAGKDPFDVLATTGVEFRF